MNIAWMKNQSKNYVLSVVTKIGKVIEMGFGFDFLVCISSQIWIQLFEMKIYGTTGKNI